MTSESLEAFAENVQGVMGSGLFPLLTLANHDCNPNASIEFLGESNTGSMIARRKIRAGQEITITYVPAGDDGASDDDDSEDDDRGKGGSGNDRSDSVGGRGGGNDEDGDIETCGSDADRFKHFKPTQTWEYFSKLEVWDDEDDEDEEDGEDEEDEEDQKSDDEGEELDEVGEGESDEEENIEGSSWRDRQEALKPYGFVCACDRCKKERKSDGDS